MKKTVCVLVAIATSVSAFGQTFKVTADSIVMRQKVILRYHGTGDGIDIFTKNSPNVLESGADLIWGAFYQAQPNNPGLLSLTSYSAGFGWNPFFTAKANGRIGIKNTSPQAALEIGAAGSAQQIRLNGNLLVASDARLKSNVQGLDNSITRIKGLRGVKYNLKDMPIANTAMPENIKQRLKDGDSDLIEQAPYIAESPLAKRTLYGFIAQELQEQFPDLVYEDEEGTLAVDYIGLIPVLVDALQSQQSEIEQLQQQFKAQQEQIETINQALSIQSSNALTSDSLVARLRSQVQLYQNMPNPFSSTTEIGYSVPKDIASDCAIIILDLNNKIRQRYALSSPEGTITVSASAMENGTFVYALTYKGEVVETRKMMKY